MTTQPDGDDAVRQAVRDRYATVARGEAGGGCCGSAAPLSCCAPKPETVGEVSRGIGYSADDLAAVPDGANLGLGCGNPTAIAALKAGETVLDLGAGGGFDCFLAARRVGPGGRVIGIDMTPDMVARARANAARDGIANVEFRLGEIEHLPVADGAIDVILSNCVVNLSPAKAQVFAEAFRVLRPGGRLCLSDIVATAPLPESWRRDPDSISACIDGAAQVGDIAAWLEAAGFEAIRITVKEESRAMVAGWVAGAERYVASAVIEARKPDRVAPACCGPSCCPG